MQNKTRYDEKISRIRNGDYKKGDFIIADAKDADLAGGILTTGLRRNASGLPIGNRSRQEFISEIEAIVEDDNVDIMLASTRTIEGLTQSDSYKNSHVKLAFRANDTSDVWGNIRGGNYVETASIPFRSAKLEHAQASLCLYSITFNNSVNEDVRSLNAYANFRDEAIEHGKGHFLEVFNPNTDTGLSPEEIGFYVNDCITRCLSGLTKAERPEFLKVAYNGAAALAELVEHDSETVVGVLGGGVGTHLDTLELVSQAERFGARIALFGRKINGAEHQTTFIKWMRHVANCDVTPKEAVAGYHDALNKMDISPDRSLADDQLVSEDALKAEAR